MLSSMSVRSQKKNEKNERSKKKNEEDNNGAIDFHSIKLKILFSDYRGNRERVCRSSMVLNLQWKTYYFSFDFVLS